MVSDRVTPGDLTHQYGSQAKEEDEHRRFD
jgi:hypothetical protein